MAREKPVRTATASGVGSPSGGSEASACGEFALRRRLSRQTFVAIRFSHAPTRYSPLNRSSAS
jgi:hypothetical protein